MGVFRAGAVRTFRSLRGRSFRLYFIGQAFSFTGTWVQRVAQAWLVLEITGSGAAIGTVAALQFLPLLLFAPMGGLLADRADKRLILYATQTVSAVAALTLGLLVLGDSIELWMIYGLALVLGLASSIDNPTRQALVLNMVPRAEVTNAVTLHSTLVNASRVLGPAIAGGLIVTVGIGWCFVLNSLSYLALIMCLALIRSEDLVPSPKASPGQHQIRQSLVYVWSTPQLLTVLSMIAVAGLFAYQYQVILPLFASVTFAGDARTFALMSASVGAGAVVGGLITAAIQLKTVAAVWRIGAVFGACLIMTSMLPTLGLVLVGLALVGATGVSFISLGNAVLQLVSEPAMRGRVMGLYETAFFGTTPLGAPIIGALGDQVGPRWAIATGGFTVIVAGVCAARYIGSGAVIQDSSSTASSG